MIPCINLMPWRTQLQQAKLHYFLKLLGLAIILLAIVMLVFHMMMRRELNILLFANQHILQKTKAFDPTINDINNILSQKQQWNDDINIIIKLRQKQFNSMLILRALAESIPNESYIDNVDYDNKKITITGYAKDNASITMIINELKNYPEFSKFTLTEVAVSNNNLLTHHFSIIWLI